MIEVVVARLDERAQRVRAMAAGLSEAERQKASRLRFERDRRRFIVARARLRELLAARLGTRPEALELASGRNGKPQLEPRFAHTGWRRQHAARAPRRGLCRALRSISEQVE
jgi:4'-phosphopantetheinyl transferase